VALVSTTQVDDALQATEELSQQTRTQRPDKERWLNASYALERALQRQQETLDHCPDATTDQRARAAQLQQEATAEMRAARLAWTLHQQPLALFDARDGHYDPASAAKQCADQLTRYNVDLLGMTPAAGAALLTDHPATASLTARVVEWLALSPDANERKHLAATLQQVTATPRPSDVWLNALATQEPTALERVANEQATAPLPAAAVVAVARFLPAASAERLLEHGVRRHPGSSALNAELGQRLQANPAKRPAALRYLAAAVAADPTFIPARLHLATALADAGQADEGLALLRETARLDAKSAAAPFRMGQILEAQGQRAEALNAYNAAIAADPSFPPAQVRVGQAALEAKKFADAEKAFRAALAFAPNDRAARFGLATVLVQKGEVTQALAQFDLASAVGAKLDARTLQTFVAALRQNKREPEAFALLQAYANTPRTPELQYEWGLYYLANDDPAALVNLQAASELLPKDATMRAAYADALATFGKFRLAATTYRQAVDLLPDADPRRATYTTAARTMTRYAGLEAHVARLGDNDIQSLSATSLAELGEVCRRTQRFAAAAKFFAFAAKTEQRHAEAAAYSAAYAGWGLGSDAASTTLADRAFLRQQALGWFTQVPKQLAPHDRLCAFLLCPGVLHSIPTPERNAWRALVPNNFPANRTQPQTAPLK
jgi:tetratricopeptide (TPR) repeat protein